MQSNPVPEQIRALNQIIAQTAYSTKEDREKAISAGCNDFISKPLHIRLWTKI